jgi:hypothetical protein
LHESKNEVIIYDYADLRVPVLVKMYDRRRSWHKAIGYEMDLPQC